MRFKNYLILSLLILSGCTEFQSVQNSELNNLNQSDKPLVSYEAFDSSTGHYQESALLDDPYVETYGYYKLQKRSTYNYQTQGQGDPDKRVNIVFIGDGYTQAEQQKYQDQVNNIISKFLNTHPMSSYKNLFLFHRIDIISDKSGVSNFSKGINIDSPLGMLEGCYGLERLLCINVELAKQAAASAPKADMIFALANTQNYGGAGYRNPALSTLSGGNLNSFELALHEFGHSFAQLGDEYEATGSSTNDCLKSANASQYDLNTLLSKNLKWYRWLDLNHVGAFKGTCYTSNHYRPTDNSKMRTLGRDFEEINSEQIIFSIYKHAALVDKHTPEGKYKADGSLFVHPSSDFAKVEWELNGKSLKQFYNNRHLDTKDLNLKKGTHRLIAKITDTTELVRDETSRNTLMTKIFKWKIVKLK